jgi:endonuclease/exonuclease/phosphatase family metal-dependent hydrolase
LEGSSAGQVENGRRIPSWGARRAGVVGLIRGSNPDVLAVQEGAAWVGQPQGYGGRRQVDDLAAALGSGYALARTEVPPTVHHYLRTGQYLLYKRAAWSPTSTRGGWNLGNGKYAAYQVLRSRTSGARTLVVSVHLAVGNGAANDAIRQRETNRLLADAAALAGPAHLPVVYAGDFNSDVNPHHAFDGPGLALRAARVADAEKVAQRLVNSRYNSANLYLSRPPAVDQSIDYVYAAPGVAVASRSVVLHLRGGRFVGVIPSDHNPVVAQLSVPY